VVDEVTSLVVVAVNQERDAVLRDLPDTTDVQVLVSGVGPVAAASTTATALSSNDYDAVISAGIAGGFAGRADVGDVIVALSSIAADLGCRTDDGFLTLTDMGLDQTCQIEFPRVDAWAQRLVAAGLSVVTGDVATLSCMTGTDLDAKQLAERHPHAVAEAMEGWGVAWAAQSFGVRAGELRTVSNIVGKRDPSTWDIAGAFDALSRAFAVLLSEPLP
jgi:futalosine hydrolase